MMPRSFLVLVSLGLLLQRSVTSRRVHRFCCGLPVHGRIAFVVFHGDSSLSTTSVAVSGEEVAEARFFFEPLFVFLC